MDWVHWNSWVDRNSLDGNGVDGNRMDGCWMNLYGDWGWVGHSVIFHISHISPVALDISVIVNNLDPAIGQGHPVIARHQFGVRILVLLEIST